MRSFTLIDVEPSGPKIKLCIKIPINFLVETYSEGWSDGPPLTDIRPVVMHCSLVLLHARRA